jgi:hypothetical protein
MNKNKLFYRFENDNLNTKDVAESLIAEILEKAKPTSSCWWSKLKSRTDDFKDNLHKLKENQISLLKGLAPNNDKTGPTMKSCPGVLDLFNRAFLVKSPCDIVLTTDSNGAFYYDIADTSMINIDTHEKNQFLQPGNDLFKNKMCIKFMLKVRLKTSGFGYLLTTPTYHSDLGFTVPVGCVEGNYADNQYLNIITFLDLPKDNETKTLTIRKGDVLAYLVPFEKCRLAFSKDNFILKRLYSGFSSKFWFR